MRNARLLLGLLTLLIPGACASSQAEPHQPIAVAGNDPSFTPATDRDPGLVEQPPAYSPYRVELWGGNSRTLPTYSSRGRTYVLGNLGERYRIHIENPTSRRVEAVVSVDGLDAIDGKTAGYEDKRGYVIPAYGDITIEGFRTSLDQVATFRFSSVRDSYAGRKGQDRNVGVIGVAFFPEREPPRPAPRPYATDEADPRGTGPAPQASPRRDAAGAAPSAPSPPASEATKSGRSGAGGAPPAKAYRPGLGTEFGEQRDSSVHYTGFQRDDLAHPSSIVQLRYNDREGLLALGIRLDPARPSDLPVRESADPFPKSGFATPPP